MRTTFIAALILALCVLFDAQPGLASYDVTGADATIGLPDDTSDGIQFLDPVQRTATVTVDKVIGVISATPPLSVSTTTDNTGTLILQGNTTVSGDIGATGTSLLAVDVGAAGTSSVFEGDVNAATMNITGAGDATLNGDLNGDLSYDDDGTVILGDNMTITGDVTNDTGIDGQGTLTLDGRGTVLGQVGALDASLFAINAGADMSTSTFFSDVYAQTVNMTGAGIVFFHGDLNGDLSYDGNGVVRLTGVNSMITGDVTNDTGEDGQGTLTLDNSTIVLGTVGVEDAALLAVNAGANGSSSTFSSDVHALSTNITGTGVLVIDGDLYGTLNYMDDGVVILASDNTIYGAVTNSTGVDGRGTLTLDHSATLTEQVGALGAALGEVNAGADASSSTFEQDVHAQRMNIIGTGSVALEGDLGGSLSYEDDGTVTLGDGKIIMGSVSNDSGIDGQGTLDLEKSGYVWGQVGAAGALLKAVNAGVTGSNSILTGDVYTQSMRIIGTGSVTFMGGLNSDLTYDDDGVATLAGSGPVSGDVINNTGIDGQGTLRVTGDSGVTGQVGAAGAALKSVDAGEDGMIATFSGDIYTQGMHVIGTGEVLLNGDLYSTLSFEDDGIATLADGKTITGAITNDTGISGRGTLTIDENATLLVSIGGAGALLKEVNAGTDGSIAWFSDDVYAQQMNITGTGDVVLTGDLNGDLNYAADGVMTLGNDGTISGAVINDTGTDGQGTLSLTGEAAVAGQIGDVDASLKEVQAGAAGTTAIFGADIYAPLSVVGTGAVVLNGNLNGALDYDADGVVTLADGMAINGAVSNTSGADLNGELRLTGTHTTGGTIGVAGGDALGLIAVTGGTLTMAHDIAAALVSVDQGATLLLSGDRSIVEGDLSVGSTTAASVDLGDHTLTLDNGGVDFAAGSSIDLTVSSASTYGRIVQAAADAVVNAGTTLNVNVTGALPHGTVLHVIDGDGGSGVAGGLTVLDNDMILSFIMSAVAGADLLLTAFVDYDPADLGGSTASAAEALAIIENQTISPDMQAILDELHHFPTALAVSHAVMQMRPYEGTAIVDQMHAFAVNERRAAIAHLAMARESGPADSAAVRREALITHALDAYEDPMLSDGPEPLFHTDVWAHGVASQVDEETRNGVDGYSALARGIVCGIDLLRMDTLIFGIASGLSTAEIEPDQFGMGTIDVEHYPLMLYAGIYGMGPWRLDALLSGAKNNYITTRRMRFGSVDRVARGEFNAQQYDFYVEGAYDLSFSALKLTPSLSLDYSYISLEDYTETGADALNLSVQAQEYTHLRSGVGLAASALWNWQNMRIMPRVYVKYQHELLSPSIQTTAAFNGTRTYFKTIGLEALRSPMEAGMSWDVVLPKDLSLRFNYDAELGDEHASKAVSAQVKARF